jgi:hypothetical protein
MNQALSKRIENFKFKVNAGKCDKCEQDALHLVEIDHGFRVGFFCKEHLEIGKKELLRGTIPGR